MPNVPVSRDLLFVAIGQQMTDEEFDELCFEFGIELDEVTSEKKQIAKERGAVADVDTASDETIYKIDVPANRYDILCLEGLARALRVFQQKEQPPRYVAVPAAQPQRLVVEKETADVRPFLVGAVLRDITFTPASYQSFIDLQEKLHQNIARKRTLVSVGTHDLDTVTGPFYYKALPPKDIVFTPLNQTECMDGVRLMEFYKKDLKIRQYLHIIEDKPRYPVIYDSKGVVCSLPPIINGDHSKITLDTKNVLIECTATDLTKASIVVDQIVAMFSQYCAKPFTYEPVEVVYPDGRTVSYPTMPYRKETVSLQYINNRIGVNLPVEEAARLLGRMFLPSVVSGPDSIEVEIPPTRADILHACDIMEDVAIAYSFNRIEKTLPKTNTVGAPFPLNKLTDQLRLEMAMAGYTETLTFSLCSLDEAFKDLRTTNPGTVAVTLANPATLEFQMCRVSLIPGVFKTMASSKKMPLPIKIFEISDVVLKDPSKDMGARNERRLCAMYYGQTSGLELVHGLLDRMMQVLNVKNVPVGSADGYFIKESNEGMFFPGRQAHVYYQNKCIGGFGIVHPEVMASYDLAKPCSVLEINIEPFL
eukprot:comp11790_c0_seq1/m.6396 comp11790_c0_seq1/g.6396  ORF comp11790_c0_seq1/g.6396 comp11790_c0_seq1/m.6396 type:complete len:591 (-) comp11790_c0_seq1:247-2019(-)